MESRKIVDRLNLFYCSVFVWQPVFVNERRDVGIRRRIASTSAAFSMGWNSSGLIELAPWSTRGVTGGSNMTLIDGFEHKVLNSFLLGVLDGFNYPLLRAL